MVPGVIVPVTIPLLFRGSNTVNELSERAWLTDTVPESTVRFTFEGSVIVKSA